MRRGVAPLRRQREGREERRARRADAGVGGHEAAFGGADVRAALEQIRRDARRHVRRRCQFAERPAFLKGPPRPVHDPGGAEPREHGKRAFAADAPFLQIIQLRLRLVAFRREPPQRAFRRLPEAVARLIDLARPLVGLEHVGGDPFLLLQGAELEIRQRGFRGHRQPDRVAGGFGRQQLGAGGLVQTAVLAPQVKLEAQEPDRLVRLLRPRGVAVRELLPFRHQALAVLAPQAHGRQAIRKGDARRRACLLDPGHRLRQIAVVREGRLLKAVQGVVMEDFPPAFAGEQRAGLVRRNGSGGQLQIRALVVRPEGAPRRQQAAQEQPRQREGGTRQPRPDGGPQAGQAIPGMGAHGMGVRVHAAAQEGAHESHARHQRQDEEEVIEGKHGRLLFDG